MMNLGFGRQPFPTPQIQMAQPRGLAQPFPTPQIQMAQPRGLAQPFVGLDRKVRNDTGVRDFRVKNWDMLQAGLGLLGGGVPMFDPGSVVRPHELFSGLLSLIGRR